MVLRQHHIGFVREKQLSRLHRVTLLMQKVMMGLVKLLPLRVRKVTLEVRPHLLLVSDGTFGCFSLPTFKGLLLRCLLGLAWEQDHVSTFVKLLKVNSVVDIEF